MGTDSVQNDVVVSMEYTLHVDGEKIDSSEGQDPLQFLVGYGNIISGLEREVLAAYEQMLAELDRRHPAPDSAR